MTVRVPLLMPPAILDYSSANGYDASVNNSMRIGTPPIGVTWLNECNAINWLLGVGGMLASWGPQNDQYGGTSIDLRARVWRRSANRNQMWFFEFDWDDDEAVTVNFTYAASGGTQTISLTKPTSSSTQLRANASHSYVEYVTSPSTGGQEARVTIDLVNTGVRFRVLSATLCELPAYTLPGASFAGVDPASCGKGRPIYHAGQADQSVAGLAYSVSLAATGTYAARRNLLFNWYTDTGVTVTATSFPATSNIFKLKPAAQIRHLSSSSTSRNAKWSIYAKVTGAGATGEVKLNVTGGATSTITISNTTGAWSSEKTIAIETDDFTQAGAIRGGTRCELEFLARKTAGTSITVYGISVGEE